MSFALITGASQGIGKALAIEFAKRKFDLVLIARTGTLLKELATTLEKEYFIVARYKCTDLSEQHAAQEIFDWCLHNNYPISMLINNAGYGFCGPFENYTAIER